MRHPSTPVASEILSVTEAGRRLGIGRALAYELARSGRIPAIRLGARRLVVPTRAFEDWLAAASAAGPGWGSAAEDRRASANPG